MKPLLLALLLLSLAPAPQDLQSRIKTFRNNKRFSVRYDRFRDETRVSVGPFFVGGTGAYVMSGRQLEMSAVFFRSPGETVKTIYLLFESRSSNWTFLKSRELFVIVDRERLSFGEGERDSDLRGRGVSESLVFDIPIETFEKISKASTSELKVGPLELTLKDEHKEAFRDLLSLSK
jgi:hypothetical protein